MNIKATQALYDSFLQGKEEIEFTVETMHCIKHIVPKYSTFVMNSLDVFKEDLRLFRLHESDVVNAVDTLCRDINTWVQAGRYMDIITHDKDYFLAFTHFDEACFSSKKITVSPSNRFYVIKCSVAVSRHIKLREVL